MIVAVSSTAQTASLLIRADRMLDVNKGAYIMPGLVLVENGRIQAIGPDITLRGNEDVIDLPGLTLLPGLIDAHVHLAWGPAAGGDSTLPGTAEARATLDAGFTTVRNPGSTANADVELARAVEAGNVIGPRIIAAGTALGLPGGVCDQVFGADARVNGDSAIVAKVRELADGGSRVIKYCAGGGVVPSPRDTLSLEFDPESARAIVTAAHARGLRVAAHAQGSRAITVAVTAGVESIEHGGWIDSTAAALMAALGTVLVPTLYRLDWLIEQADSLNQAHQATRLRETRREVFARVSRSVRLGVPIVFGTDATVIPHGLNAREFRALVEIGLTPLEAIRAATIRAAALLDMKDIGTLEPGSAADIIAVGGDPLADVRTLEAVRFVMAGGRVVRNDAR